MDPSPRATSNSLLQLQKELQDKQHELTKAYQTSMTLIESNNRLQRQLEEQNSMIQTLEHKMADSEMKIEMLDAECREYRSSMNQTNEKYEETLGELAVTREHLHNANASMTEYQHTIQSLNNDINLLNNAEHPSSTDSEETSTSTSFHRNGNGQIVGWKEKLEKQQERYDELLRECEKYRNECDLLIEHQQNHEQLRRENAEMERNNKALNEQLIELHDENVELEREINAVSAEMEEYKETVQYLQNENESLLNQHNELNGDTAIPIPSAVRVRENGDFRKSPNPPPTSQSPKQSVTMNLKERRSRKLSVGSIHSIQSISKDRSESIDGLSLGGKDSRNIIDAKESEDDLFTMVQSYENNEEYIFSETSLQDVADETQRKLMESQEAEKRHSQRVQELEEEMKMVNDQLGGRLVNAINDLAEMHDENDRLRQIVIQNMEEKKTYRKRRASLGNIASSFRNLVQLQKK